MHIKPKKRLGQNFLADPNIRRKIINACGFLDSDIVLEIGAGRGEMTELLAQRASRVFALEIDPALCVLLREKFARQSNVEIIDTDVLKFDIDGLRRGSSAKLRVIGNIPYYISTPIIEKLFENKSAIADIHLTVQKEFAERLCAAPGSSGFSSLSVFVQYNCRPKLLFTIKRSCFFPAPKVDSAFISLVPGADLERLPKDERNFFKIVRSAFGKRRKTLRNSLRGVVAGGKLDLFFKTQKKDPDVRPQELSPQEFIDLSNL